MGGKCSDCYLYTREGEGWRRIREGSGVEAVFPEAPTHILHDEFALPIIYGWAP